MSSLVAGAEMITFRAAGVDVGSRLERVGEEPGRLDDDVNAEVPPREPLRVALGEDGEPAAVDGDNWSPSALTVSGKAAEDRIVLEEVGQRGGVGEVVDGDDLELGVALPSGAVDVAADPAETGDFDLDGHRGSSLCRLGIPGRGGARHYHRVPSNRPMINREQPPPDAGGGRPSPGG